VNCIKGHGFALEEKKEKRGGWNGNKEGPAIKKPLFGPTLKLSSTRTSQIQLSFALACSSSCPNPPQNIIIYYASTASLQNPWFERLTRLQPFEERRAPLMSKISPNCNKITIDKVEFGRRVRMRVVSSRQILVSVFFPSCPTS
jgi:hypothetical protein